MKVFLSAIGKLKTGPEKELCDLYRQRLKFPLEIIESPAQMNKEQEGRLLLSQIPSASYKVALDEKGHQLSSPELAQKWQMWQEQAPSSLVFLIGGADGLSQDVKDKSNFLWSLGRLTWPHLLVRGLVLEQFYRAQQIIIGHPYHRD